MRRFYLSMGVAVLVLGGGVGAVSACWPGGSPYLPPVNVWPQTITYYQPEYRTEYHDVRHMVYREVPEVREEERREQVIVPSWREEQRQRTVMVPVTVLEKRQRTIMRTEWREEQRQREVRVPETRLVERSYTAIVPETTWEQRQQTVLVPEVRTQTRQQLVTTLRPAAGIAIQPRVALSPVPTPLFDPYVGQLGTALWGMPQVYGVPVPVIGMVPQTQVRNYTAGYLGVHPETRTVTVPVPSERREVRTEKVPVTTFRTEVETYTVRVPVSRPEIVTEEVPVTEMQARTETYTVRVPEPRTEIRIHKVPVTTYRRVAEEVVERVPETIRVEVPRQVQIRVPVIARR